MLDDNSGGWAQPTVCSPAPDGLDPGFAPPLPDATALLATAGLPARSIREILANPGGIAEDG